MSRPAVLFREGQLLAARATPKERVCLARSRSREGTKARRFIGRDLATRPFKIVIPRQAILQNHQLLTLIVRLRLCR